MRAIVRFILASVAVIGMVACSSTPGYVIPKEPMAQLLADLHTAESVVEIERMQYRTDSMKKALKQSVFMRHGVTQEQVDTSFDWYGHHISEYIEVYDRTIAILDERVEKIDATAENVAIMAVGDSVDTWPGVRTRVLAAGQPTQYVDFVFEPDENWEPGDAYEWRIKVLNNRSPLEWSLLTDYSDGTTEYVTASDHQEGWNSLSLRLDSTRTATRIYGYATVALTPNERVFLDSIALLRTRAQRDVRRFDGGRKSTFSYGRSDTKGSGRDNDTADDEDGE